jgi:AcrR family transcriptional regulator
MRTRDALQRALLRLLEVKPLDQITIRDICAVSKVGYTTFFRHHPTKGAGSWLAYEISRDPRRPH